MNTDALFRKLFEIERAIDFEDPSTIRMMVIDAQEFLFFALSRPRILNPEPQSQARN
jgi:hypothetical protein